MYAMHFVCIKHLGAANKLRPRQRHPLPRLIDSGLATSTAHSDFAADKVVHCKNAPRPRRAGEEDGGGDGGIRASLSGSGEHM